MRLMIFGFVLAVFAFPCWADTIIVDQNGSGDFNNIQNAIDYSWDGDTVIVKRGVYPEDIFFNGRAITLTSEDPNDPNAVEATIINGTVTFDFGEQENSVFKGLTVASQHSDRISTQYGTSPAIYGDIVVYQNGQALSGYDLVTKQEFAICATCFKSGGSSPAIYGNTVVWMDQSSNGPHIYGYDLVTKQVFAILPTTSNLGSPTIYGNTVVFVNAGIYNNSNIYGYDIVTQQTFAVCTATGNQGNPAIYGNIIVWEDLRSGSYGNWDIYGYDLVTKQEFAICTATGNQRYPAIYGNTVVWQDYRNSSNYPDIYGYDLVTKQAFAICTTTGSQTSPAIYSNTVVWDDQRSGSYNIYGYDLVTEQEFAICNVGGSTSPDIYGDIVVWTRGSQIFVNSQFDIHRFINTGVSCYNSFPTLAKNHFFGISAALQCYANSTPYVQDNVFVKNTTAIIDCNGTISSNDFENDAVAIWNCSGVITNNNIVDATTALSSCKGMIDRNRITDTTTALANCTGTITGNIISGTTTGLSNCIGTISDNLVERGQTGMSGCSGTITDNLVAQGGTGMSGCSGLIQGNEVSLNTNGFVSCTATFVNNIVAANAKGFQSCGGTISNNTITGTKEYALYQNSAAVKNNIIAFNQVGIYGEASNSYNCFWQNTGGNFANGAYAKTGDFFGDPKFARNGVWIGDVWQEGDYHLKSTAGRYDPNIQTWILDDVNSTCIDRGDTGDSIGYEPNPNGGRINVGNYGGTAQASKSTNGSGPEPPTTCTSPVEGDLNNDCKVDFMDLAIVASHWLECNLDPPSACWN